MGGGDFWAVDVASDGLPAFNQKREMIYRVKVSGEKRERERESPKPLEIIAMESPKTKTNLRKYAWFLLSGCW